MILIIDSSISNFQDAEAREARRLPRRGDAARLGRGRGGFRGGRHGGRRGSRLWLSCKILHFTGVT